MLPAAGKYKGSYLPVYFMAFAALVYLAVLVSFIHTGIFYSADGGVKFLVVQQVAEGHGFKFLHLPQPAWVRSIWESGFFPLRPPFVYAVPEGYVFVFPPAFQVISSVFYARFGYAGLYVLPVLSTLVLWLCFILLLKRLSVTPWRIALAFLSWCSARR